MIKVSDNYFKDVRYIPFLSIPILNTKQNYFCYIEQPKLLYDSLAEQLIRLKPPNTEINFSTFVEIFHLSGTFLRLWNSDVINQRYKINF